MPSEERCPNCGAVLYKKAGKKPPLFCQAEGCGFSKPLEEENWFLADIGVYMAT